MNFYEKDSCSYIKSPSEKEYLKIDNDHRHSVKYDLCESVNDISDLVDADEDILPKPKITGYRNNYFSNYNSFVHTQKNENKLQSNESNIEQCNENFSEQSYNTFFQGKHNNKSFVCDGDQFNPRLNMEEDVRKDEQKSRLSKIRELISNKIKYNINKKFNDNEIHITPNPHQKKQKISKKQSDEFYKRNIEKKNKNHIGIKNRIDLIKLDESIKDGNIGSPCNQLPKSEINKIVERLYQFDARNIERNIISFKKCLEEGKGLTNECQDKFHKLMISRKKSFMDKNTLENSEGSFLEKERNQLLQKVCFIKQTKSSKYMKSNNIMNKSKSKKKSFKNNKGDYLNKRKNGNKSRCVLKNHCTVKNLEKNLDIIFEKYNKK